MAVIRNDQPIYGNYKSVTQTFPTPREFNPTATDLPTTKPGTAQISFTLQQSDLPTFSAQPISVKYVPVINVSGQNNTGSAVTLNYEVHKNGATVSSGSKTNIATNNYWSIDCVFGYCVPGDLLEVFLWASVSPSFNYSYYSLYTYMSNMLLSKDQTLAKSFSITTARDGNKRNYALLASTNYNAGGLANYYINLVGYVISYVGTTLSLNYFFIDSKNGGLGYLGNANLDANIVIYTFTSTTKLVNYQGYSYFTTVSYREMLR